jgi:hypothetical protein
MLLDPFEIAHKGWSICSCKKGKVSWRFVNDLMNARTIGGLCARLIF